MKKMTSNSRKLLPYAVLSLCLLITVSLWHLSSSYLENMTREKFDLRANKITSEIDERLNVCKTILHSLSALLAVEGEVNREQWHTFIENLNYGDRYPGIQGIGFSKLIQSSELQTHVAEIRTEDFPSYTVWPDGKREEYTSIIYLEPFDIRNQRAFGYDMFSEPVRRSAMEKARDAGLAALSGKVLLVQETETDVQNGFLMYVPVYKKDMPYSNVQERKAALLGYVYSPYRAQDLMEGIFAGRLQDIDLEIYDGTDISENSLLYDTESELDAIFPNRSRSFRESKIIDIHQHQWTLYFSSLPPFETSHETRLPLGILLFGGLISVLIFIILWLQERARLKIHDALERTESVARFPDENPELVFRINAKGDVIFKNRAVDKLLEKSGFSEVDILKLFPDNIKELTKDILQTGKSLRNVESVIGDEIYSSTIVPISDWSYVNVYGINITEKKQAEESLLEERQLAQQYLDIAGVMFVALDKYGSITLINQKGCDILGYSEAEILHKNWFDLCIPDDNQEEIRGVFTQVLSGDIDLVEYYENIVVTKTGVQRIIAFHNSSIRDKESNITGILCSGEDITERKLLEEKSQESEGRFRATLEATPIVIWNQDINLCYTWIYNSHPDFKAEELIGKTDLELLPAAEGQHLTEIKRKVIESGVGTREEVQTTIAGEAFFYDLIINPMRDSSGAVIGIQCTSNDITERKQAEQERLSMEEQLHQSQKMEAVGTMVGGIAHEFNNILQGIFLYGGILTGQLQDNENAKTSLKVIMDGSKRGAKIVSQIMAFMKQSEATVEAHDLKLILQEAIELQRAITPSRIEIIEDYAEDCKRVRCDPTQMHQIIVNLCNNAQYAMPKGGTLTVGLKEILSSQKNNEQDQTFLELSISDTGMGMDKEILDKIFDPFFTTKEVGEGTGLGLSVVHGLVEQMGGSITTTSKLGKGSTFRILIPTIDV